MPLFEFELSPVEEIQPWGDADNPSLSWFALTLGTFWINTPTAHLFEYTPDALRLFEHESAAVDYQIAAFAREMLGAGAAALEPLPPFLGALAASPEGLFRRRDAQLSELEDDDLLEETFFSAWRWLGARSPNTGFLVQAPRLAFLRVDEAMHLVWDNRDRQVDGIPLWTATVGSAAMSVADFRAELESFESRLLEAMAKRLARIASGAAKPQCEVQLGELREQHARWTQEFEGYRIRKHEPDITWAETAAAWDALNT